MHYKFHCISGLPYHASDSWQNFHFPFTVTADQTIYEICSKCIAQHYLTNERFSKLKAVNEIIVLLTLLSGVVMS